MESISTGPNHSASVSVKKSLYCWGNGEGGRLGLNKEESAKSKNEPVIVSSLMSILYQNRLVMREGNQDASEDQMNGAGAEVLPSKLIGKLPKELSHAKQKFDQQDNEDG